MIILSYISVAAIVLDILGETPALSLLYKLTRCHQTATTNLYDRIRKLDTQIENVGADVRDLQRRVITGPLGKSKEVIHISSSLNAILIAIYSPKRHSQAPATETLEIKPEA